MYCEHKIMYRHVSVMPEEAVAFLNCRPGKIIADCTLGGAGHSARILEKILPDGMLIAIDQDMAAIKNADSVFKDRISQIRLFHGNFDHLEEYLGSCDLSCVDGILADVGLSLYQLEASGRGFSFSRNEPLDMRMNAESNNMTAEELVNTASEDELAEIFRDYGEERYSGRIAGMIVRTRTREKIASSLQLANIIRDVVPKKSVSRIHPATRVFMALRIAVNSELERLDALMTLAPKLLKPGGRLCVISFHSLEDRIVKHRLRAYEKGCVCPAKFPKCVCGGQKTMKILTPKALTPSEAEIAINPMARSAKLRAAEKL